MISNHDLRDHLAVERTVLANKRTLLSYIRTSILLLGSGLTLIKLFGEEIVFVFFAWIIVCLGMILIVIGSIEYIDVNQKLLAHRKNSPTP